MRLIDRLLHRPMHLLLGTSLGLALLLARPAFAAEVVVVEGSLVYEEAIPTDRARAAAESARRQREALADPRLRRGQKLAPRAVKARATAAPVLGRR